MNVLTRMSRTARPNSDPRVIGKGPGSLGTSDRAARVLGWLSAGLGAAELLRARRVAGALGLPGSAALFRAHAIREIGAGVLSLSVDKQKGIGTRVAGDLLDIAALATALGFSRGKRGAATSALALVVGVTVVDMVVYSALRKRHRRGAGRMRDYRGRTGFPAGVRAAHGAAAEDQRPGAGGSNATAE